jgi:hypothetical protein
MVTGGESFRLIHRRKLAAPVLLFPGNVTGTTPFTTTMPTASLTAMDAYHDLIKDQTVQISTLKDQLVDVTQQLDERSLRYQELEAKYEKAEVDILRFKMDYQAVLRELRCLYAELGHRSPLVLVRLCLHLLRSLLANSSSFSLRQTKISSTLVTSNPIWLCSLCRCV